MYTKVSCALRFLSFSMSVVLLSCFVVVNDLQRIHFPSSLSMFCLFPGQTHSCPTYASLIELAPRSYVQCSPHLVFASVLPIHLHSPVASPSSLAPRLHQPKRYALFLSFFLFLSLSITLAIM